MYQEFYRDRLKNIRITGNEINADCPQCNKQRHFYANKNSGQFDCKHCGISGNAITYLQEFENLDNKTIAERLESYGIDENNSTQSVPSNPVPKKIFKQETVDYYISRLPEGELKGFASERGLPIDILKKYKLGMDLERNFTLPVYNEQGRIRDIRRRKIGGDTISSIGANVFLFGIQDLLSNETIFLTEGSWSKMALESQGYASVGVCGANTFKDEYVPYFKDKKVYIVYDLDSGGEQGTRRVIEKLSPVAKEISVVRLPKELGEGKDVRDFFKNGGTKEQFEELIRRAEVAKKESRPVGLSKVKELFNKWLYLEDDTIIDIVLATVVANRLPSDPVWLFLVGSPGSSKTEILRSLKTDEIFSLSSLSQHSLISGFTVKSKKQNNDPSLLQYLDKKVLVIKDFTNVLQMDRHARDELFATLRDAYDGYSEKAFGSEARVRRYKAKFGLLAGVTPEIDRFYSVNQALGERFLKYRVNSESRKDMIIRASSIKSQKKEMREELQQATNSFLVNLEMRPVSIPKEFQDKFIKLAQAIAWIRSTVSRNGYNRNIEFLPELEVGTRLVQQFESLAEGLALVRGKNQIGKEEYDLIVKIAKDTLHSKRKDLIRVLILTKEPEKTNYFGEQLRLSTNTIRECLEDFYLLQVVDRIGKYNADGSVDEYSWVLRQEIRDLIYEAEL